MKWYIAKLVFSIETNAAHASAQFDEQVRLVKANNDNEAYFKIRRIGKTEEVSFSNTTSNNLQWQFIDVSEMVCIGDITDGIEVYSNTVEVEEKNNYINAVLKKGMGIQTKNLVLV